MSEILKVYACVYSRKGNEREVNRDDFYMNGKFLSEHHLDNVQAAIENRGNEYFFAVADHMEFSDDEQRASFSILREIGKFHERITVHEGDLDFKMKELSSRVAETGRYLDSFLDMTKVPQDDIARQKGFAGLLLTDGKAVAATYGSGRIYLCRGEEFKQLATESGNPQRLVNLGIIDDEEAEEFEEKYQVADVNNFDESVILSEPITLQEGDKFLIISDGVYHALGDEKLEDILSMRSDSAYISYRMIHEAMKQDGSDDMTAMVVGIERISAGTAAPKKPIEQRPKASALKSTPAPTYKYQKGNKNYRKYDNLIYYTAVFLTAVLIIAILYLIISNIFKNLNQKDPVDRPPITATITPTPPPELSPEPTPPETTPEPTPEPTPAPVTEYTVKSGDTLTRIVREHYGSTDQSLIEKFGAYNGLQPPYNIQIGQKLKVPPKEELLNSN